MTEINERIAKIKEQIIDTKIIRHKLGLEDYDEIIDDFEVLITTIESLQVENKQYETTVTYQQEAFKDQGKEILQYRRELESQKEEIERLTLQIKRAHLSLTWSNTENQIPHAIHYLEQAAPITPESPEYVAAAKIFLQEGEKP